MRRFARDIQARGRDDRGFSLVEVMVAMMILSIVMVVFYSVLASVQRSAARQSYLTQNNDQARLAIEQIDREVRSGNVFYDPATEPAATGYAPAPYRLRVYTQANATTRTPAPGYLCTVWQINSQRQLQTRVWPPYQPQDATGWRVVAEGIVNRDLSSPVSAFQLDSDPTKGGRTINITLMVNTNANLTTTATETQQIQNAITGRDTSYGFPQDACNILPT